MEKCVACQFYDRDDAQSRETGARWGKCRRTGPIVHPVSAKAYMVEGIWPHVRDDDWCGEFTAAKRRLEPAAAGAMSSLLMQSASARPAAAAVTSLLVPLPAAAPAVEAPVPSVTERLGAD